MCVCASIRSKFIGHSFVHSYFIVFFSSFFTSYLHVVVHSFHSIQILLLYIAYAIVPLPIVSESILISTLAQYRLHSISHIEKWPMRRSTQTTSSSFVCGTKSECNSGRQQTASFCFVNIVQQKMWVAYVASICVILLWHQPNNNSNNVAKENERKTKEKQAQFSNIKHH